MQKIPVSAIGIQVPIWAARVDSALEWIGPVREDFEFLWLMDDDTLPEPDALEQFLSADGCLTDTMVGFRASHFGKMATNVR